MIRICKILHSAVRRSYHFCWSSNSYLNACSQGFSIFELASFASACGKKNHFAYAWTRMLDFECNSSHVTAGLYETMLDRWRFKCLQHIDHIASWIAVWRGQDIVEERQRLDWSFSQFPAPYLTLWSLQAAGRRAHFATESHNVRVLRRFFCGVLNGFFGNVKFRNTIFTVCVTGWRLDVTWWHVEALPLRQEMQEARLPERSSWGHGGLR